jgi:hypothetical protein
LKTTSFFAELKRRNVYKYAVSGWALAQGIARVFPERDKMFDWLEGAYTEHDPGLTQLLATPFILNYKDDPRFVALCQKLKVQVPPTAAPKP